MSVYLVGPSSLPDPLSTRNLIFFIMDLTQCLGPPATDTDELRPQLRKFLVSLKRILLD